MARILIGAGGTGGHVYPALATAEALLKYASAASKLRFVGTQGGGGFERRLVEQSAIAFDSYHEVFAGPIVGVSPVRLAASLLMMMLGFIQSLFILGKHWPDVILFTGGWANVPVALAAWILRIPMLVYLPDIEPGRTIQFLGKIVAKVAISVPESAGYFREGQAVLTGYPLRKDLTSATREQACAHFGLAEGRKIILVTGGSRGARSINIAVEKLLEDLLMLPVEVIHVTGNLDWERSQRSVKAGGREHYHAFPYLESAEMGLAFAAADIIVGRAGASALGEFPYFGAASILIPYPHAWRYQKTNADWLVKHGAGIRINDEDVERDLLSTLRDLIISDARLAQMKSCAQGLHQGDGAQNLALALLTLAGE